MRPRPGRPAPSDRDPIPAPFDGTYGTTDRYDFHYRIRYHRNDRFVLEHILDDRLRRRLDVSWSDLYAAQGHHDILLTFLSSKFNFDLGGRKAADLDDR